MYRNKGIISKTSVALRYFNDGKELLLRILWQAVQRRQKYSKKTPWRLESSNCCERTLCPIQKYIYSKWNGFYFGPIVIFLFSFFFFWTAPKEILETESEKKLCMRFFSGTCMFGVMCRYSHYTPEQMTELQQQGGFSRNVLHGD